MTEGRSLTILAGKLRPLGQSFRSHRAGDLLKPPETAIWEVSDRELRWNFKTTTISEWLTPHAREQIYKLSISFGKTFLEGRYVWKAECHNDALGDHRAFRFTDEPGR